MTGPRRQPRGAPTRRGAVWLLALITLLALLSLGLAACGDDATTTTAGDTATTGGGGTDTTGDASSETSAPAPAVGDQLFATLCAGCHGNDGKSGFAPPVVESGADDIRQAVTQGKGDMPSFGDKLSTEEIEALVAYTESLQ